MTDRKIGAASPAHRRRLGQPARLLRHLGRLQEGALWVHQQEEREEDIEREELGRHRNSRDATSRGRRAGLGGVSGLMTSTLH